MTMPKHLRLDFKEYCEDCSHIDAVTKRFARIVNNKPWDECIVYCKNERLCQHLMTHVVAKEESK